MIQPKEEPSNVVFKIAKDPAQDSPGTRVAWSKDHDSKLIGLVTTFKGKNWKRIAQEMQETFSDPELTAKKCRERWCNCTNPDIDKTSLTETEELFLLVYHYEYKNKWVLISKHLPHRNSSKLKNNFSSLIRKVARKISLNEKETVTSPFEFIQMMYASMLIHDLTSIKNSNEEALAITPIHIYRHVQSKGLTCAQCLDYMNKMTKNFVARYKDKSNFQKLLSIDKIDTIKSFLDKLLLNIKKAYSPTSNFTNYTMLFMIEALLIDKPLTSNTTSSTIPKLSPPTILPGSIKPVSPPNDFSFVMCGFPIAHLEPEISHMPSLPNYPFSMPQMNTGFTFPLPTFTSPAFQANLSSPPHNFVSPVSNPLISPSYFSQMMRPSDQPFLGIPQSSPISGLTLIPPQSRASDFSNFTNKYVDK